MDGIEFCYDGNWNYNFPLHNPLLKLWNSCRFLDQGGNGGGELGAGLASADRTTKNFDTPYVVKLHNFAHVAGRF